ncbi:universal stress protein [Geitlerinema sp. P-1104]|uniref:universal stress protein n=1 Tax=Geitlerinema sp. P-1104 TaxID=2546230 RepID=UPI00147760F8|nr:universal stress protein [Geitlerinema sp. P-1104]NMG59472.1 universal stress protein [Geitlerinema sp. P-1104]
MTFHKILVALDDSKSAPKVFRHALNTAVQDEAELMVFHCTTMQRVSESVPLMGTGIGIDLSSSKMMFEMQQEHLKKEAERVQKLLENYVSKAETEGVKVTPETKFGDPGSWICDVAQNWQADLIVLGRRGHRGLKEVLLGSVSNYVLHHANCSVMVVQGG